MAQNKLFSVLVLAASLCVSANVYAKDKPSPELKCLTDMAYTEARGEGKRGIKATIDVMFNRIKSSHFPNGVCKNFYARNQYEGARHVPRKHSAQYKHVMYLAAYEYQKFLTGKWVDSTKGATFFNTTGKPATKRVRFIKRIGHHYFYRIK